MTTTADELRQAAALLRESEIIAIEVNNPPDSRCRELWPFPAEPLAALLVSLAGEKDENRAAVECGLSPYPVPGLGDALAFARSLLTHAAVSEGTPGDPR